MRYCRSILVLLLLGGGFAVAEAGRAQTPISPGTSMPSPGSVLQRLEGAAVAPQALTGERGTVFVFWQPQCPWVQKYRSRVLQLASTFQSKGIRFVLVDPGTKGGSSGTEERPATYVRDPNAAFARALGATRAPQAFVFAKDRTLAYVGAIDDSPSGAERVEAPYLRLAVEAIAAGKAPEKGKQSAFGCALRYTK